MCENIGLHLVCTATFMFMWVPVSDVVHLLRKRNRAPRLPRAIHARVLCLLPGTVYRRSVSCWNAPVFSGAHFTL